jgi:GH15 family glucan-1,4-alpha-glucosidase
LRIAHRRGEKRKQQTVWERERASLKLQLRERGWNEHLQSYTAAYGSDDLDASLLLLGMSEIEDESQRLRGTIAAVRERLSAGGVLLYRNLPNGKREANEGAFLPCTFWLIDALARAGQVDDAEALMAGAIHLGGELGLLAEEVDPSTGDMLGNYPQALSHSTLVSAALSIEEAKASKTRQESPRTPHAPAR